MNDLNVKIECKECKTMVDVTKDKVSFNVPFKDKTGQTILLTYFDCPVCHTRHYVQIDDRRTSELRKDATKLTARAFSKRSKGKQIPQKQNDKLKKQRRQLSMLRDELMQKYEGSTVTNTITGEEVELHFSVC